MTNIENTHKRKALVDRLVSGSVLRKNPSARSRTSASTLPTLHDIGALEERSSSRTWLLLELRK